MMSKSGATDKYGAPRPQPLAQAGEQPPESGCRDAVWVRAENADAASEAFREWLAHVEAGKIG